MNRSRRKGTDAETAVVAYLHEIGYQHAERRAMASVNDRGDVSGIPGVVLEVKNRKETDLAGWLDETERERANAGATLGVVWHKRRGRGSAGEWYVTMSGETFGRMLKEFTD